MVCGQPEFSAAFVDFSGRDTVRSPNCHCGVSEFGEPYGPLRLQRLTRKGSRSQDERLHSRSCSMVRSRLHSSTGLSEALAYRRTGVLFFARADPACEWEGGWTWGVLSAVYV